MEELNEYIDSLKNYSDKEIDFSKEGSYLANNLLIFLKYYSEKMSKENDKFKWQETYQFSCNYNSIENKRRDKIELNELLTQFAKDIKKEILQEEVIKKECLYIQEHPSGDHDCESERNALMICLGFGMESSQCNNDMTML